MITLYTGMRYLQRLALVLGGGLFLTCTSIVLSAQQVKTLKLGSSMIYVGETKKDWPRGVGKMYTISAGKKYLWKEGTFDGLELVKGKKYHLKGYGGLHESGSFKNDELEGKGVRYDVLGELSESGEFSKGKLHGQGARYIKGKLYEVGQFAAGELHGMGCKVAFETGYGFEMGQVALAGNFVNGELSGLACLYHKNGKVSVIGYFSGYKLSGAGRKFLEDGTVIEEGYYSNNKLNGAGRKFYPSGVVSEEGTYRNGRLNGSGRLFYKDGSLSILGNYSDGSPEGYYIRFSEKRKVRLERVLHKGRCVGASSVFDAQGRCLYSGDEATAWRIYEDYEQGRTTSLPARSSYSQASSGLGSLIGAVAVFAGAAWLANKLFPDPPKASSSRSSSRSSSSSSSSSESEFSKFNREIFSALTSPTTSSSSSSRASSRSHGSSTSTDTSSSGRSREPHYDSPNDIPVPEITSNDSWGEKNYEYEYTNVTFSDGRTARVYRTTGKGETHTGYGVWEGAGLPFGGSFLQWYSTFENAARASYVLKYYTKTRTIGLL